MSILDEDIKYFDIKIVENIFKAWIVEGSGYRACGFYKGIGESITELPDDWENWVLYYCTGLSNYGDYCCVIAPPDFEGEYANYEPFKFWERGSAYPTYKVYTVRDLLKWYETNNEL